MHVSFEKYSSKLKSRLVSARNPKPFCWPRKVSGYVHLPSKTLIPRSTSHLIRASIKIILNFNRFRDVGCQNYHFILGSYSEQRECIWVHWNTCRMRWWNYWRICPCLGNKSVMSTLYTTSLAQSRFAMRVDLNKTIEYVFLAIKKICK